MTGAPAEAANDVIKYGDTAVCRRVTITALALCITVTQGQYFSLAPLWRTASVNMS